MNFRMYKRSSFENDSTDLTDFYCIRYCQDKVCIFGKFTIFFYKKEFPFFLYISISRKILNGF